MAGGYLTPNAAQGMAGRPLPQTTQGSSVARAAFIAASRSASRTGYQYVSTTPFGQIITQPLRQAPGYLRYLNVTTQMTGASGATGAVGAPDAPFNYFQFISFQDAWSTPLILGDGFRIFYLLRKYSGMAGLLTAATISNLPSWSAIAANGSFTFRSTLPLEGAKGYGVISIGSASLLPQLMFTTAGENIVYSTAPSAAPTQVSVSVDEAYYDVDPNNPQIPMGNGSTFQTSVVTGQQQFAANSNTKVELPRSGGYITSLILDVRDSTNARQDVWSNGGRIQLIIDGVTRFDESFAEAQDRMFEVTGGVPRDTGILAYTFKESISQLDLGLADTLETILQTSAGTQLELWMIPWGSGGTPPYSLNATITQLVPAGPVPHTLG